MIEAKDDPVGMIVKGENVGAPDGERRGWLIKNRSDPDGCTRLRMHDG